MLPSVTNTSQISKFNPKNLNKELWLEKHPIFFWIESFLRKFVKKIPKCCTSGCFKKKKKKKKTEKSNFPEIPL